MIFLSFFCLHILFFFCVGQLGVILIVLRNWELFWVDIFDFFPTCSNQLMIPFNKLNSIFSNRDKTLKGIILIAAVFCYGLNMVLLVLMFAFLCLFCSCWCSNVEEVAGFLGCYCCCHSCLDRVWVDQLTIFNNFFRCLTVFDHTVVSAC